MTRLKKGDSVRWYGDPATVVDVDEQHVWFELDYPSLEDDSRYMFPHDFAAKYLIKERV